MFYCVFVRVSHSNQEERASLQKKGLKSLWLASIQGLMQAQLLEVSKCSSQQHLST